MSVDSLVFAHSAEISTAFVVLAVLSTGLVIARLVSVRLSASLARCRVRVRIRRPSVPGFLRSALSVVGFVLVCAPAGARERVAVPPDRHSDLAPPLPSLRHPELISLAPPGRQAELAPAAPWSDTSGPPPHPLVSTGRPQPWTNARLAARTPWDGMRDHAEREVAMKGPDDVVASGEGRRVDAAAEKTARRSSHPAIHGSARGSVVPLFPRAGSRARSRDRSQLEEAQRERLESMRRHPAGKGLPPHGCARGHVVRRGDSLWSISARVLHTDDVDEVGDYWPELYSANRTVVGDDPDLICPGQVLTLPECEE